MKRLLVFCILVLLLASQLACNLLTTFTTTAMPVEPGAAPLPVVTSEPADTPQPEPVFTDVPVVRLPTSTPISLDVLKNFTYWVEDFKIEATLQEGTFNDGQVEVRLVEPVGLGDLNGDGQEDAALILIVDPSGSGTFFYLTTVLNENGTLKQAAWVYIGDRQGIQNLEIVNGQINLDYITQGPNDPLSGASQHRLRSYHLEDSTLHLINEQILDNP